MVGVGQEQEGQLVLGREFLVGGGAVLADADDGGVSGPEGAVGRRKGAGLPGAAGGVVPRVEVEHHPLAAEIGQAVRGAGGVGQGEIGGEGVLGEHGG